MIKKVHHLLNNRVIVLDEKGINLLEYQGRFEDVISRIMKDATPETEFYVGGMVFKVNRDLFENKGYYNCIKKGEHDG